MAKKKRQSLKSKSDNVGLETSDINIGRLWREVKSAQLKYGQNDPRLVAPLSELADAFKYKKNYQKELDIREWVYRICKVNYSKSDYQYIGNSLFHIGVCHYFHGSYDEAISCLQEALEILRAIQPANQRDVAGCLGYIGNCYSNIGNYREAISCHQESLEILRDIPSIDKMDIASCFTNLGNCYRVIGKTSEALTCHQESLEIYRESQRPEIAIGLINVGSCQVDLNNFHEALSWYQEALGILRKTQQSDHPYIAASLDNMGGCYTKLNNFIEALSCHQEALEIYSKSQLPDHQIMIGMARHYYKTGDCHSHFANYPEALSCYQEALKLYMKVAPADHMIRAFILNSISLINSSMDHFDQAVALSKMAVNILQKVRCNIKKISSNALQVFDKRVDNIYQHLAELLFKVNSPAESMIVLNLLQEKECFEFIDSNASSEEAEAGRMPYNAYEVNVSEAFNQNCETMYELSTRCNVLNEKKKTGINDEERHELQRLEDRLVEVEKEFASFFDRIHNEQGLEPRQDVQNIENVLYRPEPGCVLIYTVATDKGFHTIFTNCHGIPLSNSTYAVNKVNLQDKINSFRTLIQDLNSDLPELLNLAQELYDIILRPWKDEIEKAGNTILWMLEGHLRLLPVCALHDGEQYLVEKHQNVLVTPISRSNSQSIPVEKWHALGMGSTKEVNEELKALYYVKDEITSIVGETGLLDGTSLLDDEFTWTNMKNELDTSHVYKAVHIATHFDLKPQSHSCKLYFGDGNSVTLDDIKLKRNLFHGVDLVAFSACNTGISSIRDCGREIDGIGYVAERQGAQAVLATLWPVADASTALLMKEFYRLRNDVGLSKGEALRQVQHNLLKKELRDTLKTSYPHPYYWAPYFLIGNYK